MFGNVVQAGVTPPSSPRLFKVAPFHSFTPGPLPNPSTLSQPLPLPNPLTLSQPSPNPDPITVGNVVQAGVTPPSSPRLFKVAPVVSQVRPYPLQPSP